LDISDDKEEDFNDNINFYVLCLLLSGYTLYEFLKNDLGERRRFINNTFQSLSRAISYFVGLAEFLINVLMSIVNSGFYTMINLYTIRPNAVKSVNVENDKTKKKF